MILKYLSQELICLLKPLFVHLKRAKHMAQQAAASVFY